MKGIIAFGLVLLGTSLGVEAQNSLTNGLVAYYPFTGDANDASGNGHNGTVYGATLAPDRSGQPNQAYHFDGSSRIFIGNSDLVTGSALTLAAWIKPDSVSSNWMNLISGGTQNSYQLALTTNSVVGGLNFRPPSVTVTSTSGTVQTNNWAHLALVYDGANCSLFINGSIVAIQTASGPLYQDSEEILNIGAYQYYYNGTVYNDAFAGFVGSIDEVRIYNRALSGQEIAQLALSPYLNIAKAVRLDYQYLIVGTNYQLQSSSDLSNWLNIGSPFIASATTNSQYLDVGSSNVFFRLAIP